MAIVSQDIWEAQKSIKKGILLDKYAKSSALARSVKGALHGDFKQKVKKIKPGALQTSFWYEQEAAKAISLRARAKAASQSGASPHVAQRMSAQAAAATDITGRLSKHGNPYVKKLKKKSGLTGGEELLAYHKRMTTNPLTGAQDLSAKGASHGAKLLGIFR
jgi:hypothetical protein